MTIKVSVVVPVYNPGSHIDGLIASLRRQTLPRAEFEVIFVDDGSTDGTGDQLDRLAESETNFRVIHIPNSGWPGKPRNVGIDAARGEYVQFVDNDDELGDEALERMYNYAVENDSDVLVGRELRRNRAVPLSHLFDVNRPKATLDKDPLLTVLTPHKMFRRSFLDEVPLRFPEGRRRLEDHPFVTKAYFRANVISVLSDYPCYYWIQRTDRSNAGLSVRNWQEWHGHLRDVLDVVVEHTEPGDFRNRLLAHWYRSKGLRSLGTGFERRTADDARKLYDSLRQLTEERFPEEIDDHLEGIKLVRSRLLRADDFDSLHALAAVETGMRLEQRLESLGWRDGSLHIRLSARLVYADGQPVRFRVQDGQATWAPPVSLGAGATDEMLDFTSQLDATRLDLIIRDRRTADTYRLPAYSEHAAEPSNGWRLAAAVRTFKIDPDTVIGGGRIGPGAYDLDVHLTTCGWWVRGLLRAPDGAAAGTHLLPVRSDPLTAIYATRSGHVLVDVAQRHKGVLSGSSVDIGAVSLHRSPSGVEVHAPVTPLRLDGELDVSVRLVPRKGKAKVVPGRLEGRGDLEPTRLVFRSPVLPALLKRRVVVKVGDRTKDMGLRLRFSPFRRVRPARVRRR